MVKSTAKAKGKTTAKAKGRPAKAKGRPAKAKGGPAKAKGRPAKAKRRPAKADPNKPPSDIIRKINTMANKLNKLYGLDLWIYDLPKKFILNEKDLPIDKLPWYVIEPQSYDKLTKFVHPPYNMSFNDYFSIDASGNLVTGTGWDLWVIYKPGLLKAMTDLYNRKK